MATVMRRIHARGSLTKSILPEHSGDERFSAVGQSFLDIEGGVFLCIWREKRFKFLPNFLVSQSLAGIVAQFRSVREKQHQHFGVGRL